MLFYKRVIFIISIINTVFICKLALGKESFSKKELLSRVRFLDPLQNQSHFSAPTLESIEKGIPNPYGDVLSNKVYCRYYKRKSGGHNPKFACHVTNSFGKYINKFGQVISKYSDEKISLKVKYKKLRKPNTAQEKDMYTETFGSHFLWALGFPSDPTYITDELVCFDCSLDPFTDKDPVMGTQISFKHASYQFKYPGKTASKSLSLYDLSKRRGRGYMTEPQAIEFDAWIVLMNLLVHSSNRSHQQKIHCFNNDPNCENPVAYINDIGSIFGSQYSFYTLSKDKGKIESWIKFPVWRDESKCKMNLLLGGNGRVAYFTRAYVSEEGKQLALKRLKLLIDDPETKDLKLMALFKKAKFQYADYALYKFRTLTGASRYDDEIFNLWVTAFKTRVKEIENVSCPSIKPINHYDGL